MLYLWIVHYDGLTRREFQSAVPLISGDSFLIFCLFNIEQLKVAF